MGQALHGNWWSAIQLFRRDTTYDAYNLFEQVIQRDRPLRLCRRKAMECQRTAMTTTNPVIRSRFFHLAKLWREMADEAARASGSSASEARGVLIFLNQFQKSK